jgi:hypothetical protein
VLARELDTSLVIAKAENYAYSLSSIFNMHLTPAELSVDATYACRIQDFVDPPTRMRLVRGVCNGDDWAVEEMAKIRAAMANCTSILDIDHSEVFMNNLSTPTMLDTRRTDDPRPQRLCHGLDPRQHRPRIAPLPP